MSKISALAVYGTMAANALFGGVASGQNYAADELSAQQKEIQNKLYAAKPSATPMAYLVDGVNMPMDTVDWGASDKGDKALDIDGLLDKADRTNRHYLHFTEGIRHYNVSIAAIKYAYERFKCVTNNVSSGQAISLTGMISNLDNGPALTNRRRQDLHGRTLSSCLILEIGAMKVLSSTSVEVFAGHEGQHNRHESLGRPDRSRADQNDWRNHSVKKELLADKGISDYATLREAEEAFLDIAGWLNDKIAHARNETEQTDLMAKRQAFYGFEQVNYIGQGAEPSIGQRLVNLQRSMIEIGTDGPTRHPPCFIKPRQP